MPEIRQETCTALVNTNTKLICLIIKLFCNIYLNFDLCCSIIIKFVGLVCHGDPSIGCFTVGWLFIKSDLNLAANQSYR